jgi:hypothetical protein
MQATIIDALTVVAACLVVVVLALVFIVFRPAKRRHRRRKGHSHRPKIDLFTDKPAGSAPGRDA